MLDQKAAAKRIEELLLDFLQIYSATGTAEENGVVAFYRKWFDSMEYFRAHPDQAGFFQIPGDPFGRTTPWCLLKGAGSETVVLLHHYDVVDTDDYKNLQPLALKPYELMEAFKAGRMALTEEPQKDLESGEWLFGRGAADMKAGGVIQMALIEQYAKRENFKGNLVLLGLADEENLSAGGRTAPLLLKELKEKFGLDYVLALNGEPTDSKRGRAQPKIHVGSIGKIMPLIHAQGTLSHAGMVYDGLNPVKIMAEVVHRLDLNPAFIDEAEGVTSPAATFLYHKDEKQIYDVSLPLSASGYMSIMFLRRSPDEMMRIVRDECVKAFDAVIENVQKSYDAYAAVGGGQDRKLPWKTNVKLYAELQAEALRDSGAAFTEAMKKLSAELKKKVEKGEMNLVDASLAVVKQTLRHVKDQSPCIVIALVPPYYPVVANSMLGEKAAKVNEVTDRFIERAKKQYGEDYVKYYIVGMSDLSYFMQNPAKSAQAYVEENMLLWNDLYGIPFDALEEISMPVLNVGPLGRDVHKYTERVLKKDLYERTPELMAFTIDSILN